MVKGRTVKQTPMTTRADRPPASASFTIAGDLMKDGELEQTTLANAVTNLGRDHVIKNGMIVKYFTYRDRKGREWDSPEVLNEVYCDAQGYELLSYSYLIML